MRNQWELAVSEAAHHAGFFYRHVPIHLLSQCSLSFLPPAQICEGKAVLLLHFQLKVLFLNICLGKTYKEVDIWGKENKT